MTDKRIKLAEPQEEGSREACAVLLALSRGALNVEQLLRVVKINRFDMIKTLRGLKERNRITWDTSIPPQGAWRVNTHNRGKA